MPQSNAFLIINLGCEMLYVIDQRLKAQNITVEKSAQVLRDLTCVLLDQKLIEQLLSPHPNQTVLTIQQCRILLTDIACCSLMRLDINSMDKLWDLMTMLLKWQVFHTNDDPEKLLNVTFRHMDGVGKLLPEMQKTLLIDSAKRRLIAFWDTQSMDARANLLTTVQQWLHVFHVKISILIRLGLQRSDASFETQTDFLDSEMCQCFVTGIGENVYAKNNTLKATANSEKKRDLHQSEMPVSAATTFIHELSSLVDQLGFHPPTDACEIGSNCNFLLLDDVNCSVTTVADHESEGAERSEDVETTAKFIHVEHTQSTLQKYLHQFRLENESDPVDESSDSKDDSVPFDATEELLKMLDRD